MQEMQGALCYLFTTVRFAHAEAFLTIRAGRCRASSSDKALIGNRSAHRPKLSIALNPFGMLRFQLADDLFKAGNGFSLHCLAPFRIPASAPAGGRRR